jgi:hypothetical protein
MLEPSTISAGISWLNVYYGVGTIFILFALNIQRYRRIEAGHLRRARTISFAAASIGLLAGLAVQFWFPGAETVKAIVFIVVTLLLGVGLRFTWLADKAEKQRENRQDERDREQDGKGDTLLSKIQVLESYHARHLPNVRDRATLICNEMKSYMYSKGSKGAWEGRDLLAIKPAVSGIVSDFESHAITDQEMMLLLATGYMDLELLAHGIDRLIKQADDRLSEKKLTDILHAQQTAARVQAQERLLGYFNDIGSLILDHRKAELVLEETDLDGRYHNDLDLEREFNRLYCARVLAALESLSVFGMEPDVKIVERLRTQDFRSRRDLLCLRGYLKLITENLRA